METSTIIILIALVVLLIILILFLIISSVKQKPSKNNICDFNTCNKVMEVWIKMEGKGDFDDSRKTFKQCKNCPQRAFKLEDNAVMKYGQWSKHRTLEDAYTSIAL